MGAPRPARTYNQNHIARPYTPGRRRLSLYWTWSYPWEAQRSPAAMENRFSTLTEVRNVLWPAYETPEWSEARFLQGIAGTLELFHRSTLNFQALAGEATGHPVAVFQRIDQAGFPQPIDEAILADTDTLMVFGLDHLPSEQEASPEEIGAIRQWLQREGTCLLLAPHHDVGFTDDMGQRQQEYLHHGDPLVPRQQRFGRYTRSLMEALDVPVHNTYGLRPAVVEGTRNIAPLTAFRDLDRPRLLANVPTLNFHPHLPHYEVTGGQEGKTIHVLARQPIERARPHPFTTAGNTEFNCLLWMPPSGARAGDIVLVDLDPFHHPVRRRREPRDLLAQSRPDELSKPGVSLAALVGALFLAALAGHAAAQNRGTYPLGMSAINAGVTPPSGFTYVNQLLFYSRDQEKDNAGAALPATGQNAVLLDLNSFIWVSKFKILGARYSAVATLPLAANSLSSDLNGPISGGSGFGDAYFIPVILGWNRDKLSLRLMAGVLAPTGRYSAGASNNVGNGYWSPTLSSGQTVPLVGGGRLTFSAFEMYEFHTTQQGTGVRPGGNVDLDYSLMTAVPGAGALDLHVGLVGYEQWQTSAKTGPGLSVAESTDRYLVNALGLGVTARAPRPKLNFGLRIFKEFANRSTFQGYSVQAQVGASF